MIDGGGIKRIHKHKTGTRPAARYAGRDRGDTVPPKNPAYDRDAVQRFRRQPTGGLDRQAYRPAG